MGMESISRVTAAQSYQANTAASQPAPVTNVETSDAVAQDKQTEVKSSQQSDNTGSSQTSDNSEKNAATVLRLIRLLTAILLLNSAIMSQLTE